MIKPDRSACLFASLFICSFLVLLSPVYSASNLEITPTVISHDFTGDLVIKAQVVNGSNTRIDFIPDYNGNGQADAFEIADSLQSYFVTDNRQFKIQDQVIPHVAGDYDSRMGWLEVRLPQNRLPFFYGSFVVRADDGAGAVEQVVHFQQNPTGIQVQGTIYQNGDEQNPTPAYVFILNDSEVDELNVFIPTDQEGNYSVWLSRAGSYGVIAMKPGMFSAIEEGAGQEIYREPGMNDPVNLNLVSAPDRLRTISGRVTNDQDDPIPFALMVAFPLEDDDMDIPVSVGLTDLNGEYELSVLDGVYGVGAVRLEFHGYVNSDEEIVLEDIVVSGEDVSGQDIQILTPVVSVIKGRILDGRTEQPYSPVEGRVIVEAYVPDGGDDRYFTASGIDRNGEFILGVLEETWKVEILPSSDLLSAGLVIPRFDPVAVGGNQVVDLGDIVLQEAAGSIRVQAINEDGLPLRDIGIYINYDGNWQHPNSGWVNTGEDGTAVFLVAEPGMYFTGPGFQSYEDYPFLISPPGVYLDVAQGEMESITFTMVQGGLIEGWFRGDGRGLVQGDIRIYPEDADSLLDWIENRFLYPPQDRPEGVSYWVPLPPGRYKVYAHNALSHAEDPFGFAPEFHSGKYDILQADVVEIPAVGSRVRVDFDLKRGGKLSGQVRMERNHQLVGVGRGVLVEAFLAGTQQRIAATTADWNVGAFDFHLPAGSYLFRLSPRQGTYIFSPTWHDRVLQRESATAVEISDFQLTRLDFLAEAIIWTIGDINLSGRVEGTDLFWFSTAWQQHPDSSPAALLSDFTDTDTIDAGDLAAWIRLFRHRNR